MSSKKSESLEIRLSQPLKDAFMARCRLDGGSASETVRRLIEGHLAPAPGPRRSRTLRLLVAASAAISVVAIAAPSLARAGPRAVFAALDKRHVGRLTFQDFAAAATIKTSISLTHAQRLPAIFYGALDLRPLRPEQTDSLDPKLSETLLRGEFERIDRDGDGEISFEEFRRYYGD